MNTKNGISRFGIDNAVTAFPQTAKRKLQGEEQSIGGTYRLRKIRVPKIDNTYDPKKAPPEKAVKTLILVTLEMGGGPAEHKQEHKPLKNNSPTRLQPHTYKLKKYDQKPGQSICETRRSINLTTETD